MIASRKQDACDVTADEIQRATGRRALGRACHVGRWNELQGLVDAAYEHFGQVDVLVNNAGMSPLYPSVEAVSEELWDKVLGVNLKGPFRLTALIGSRMAQGSGGSIINISSGAASRPTPDVIPYAAAKAGLEAMTVGFARAFAPKVRVNAIQAGRPPTRRRARGDRRRRRLPGEPGVELHHGSRHPGRWRRRLTQACPDSPATPSALP